MAVIEMRNITKRFGSVVANNCINFSLERGEIHALLGENGAGKTTLMRILYGLYHADQGEILVDDRPVHIASPREAIALGIGMVSQHFTLVPPLSVAENVVLGYIKGLRFDPTAAHRQVAEAASRYSIEIDPTMLVRHLSVGERQRVEILKALYRNARVLILDEPTSVLTPQEANALFESLERLRKAGLSVIFISHKLNEVMAICDRITVLRQGRVIGTAAKDSITPAELARMMVSQSSQETLRREQSPRGEVCLALKGVSALDKKGLPALKNINLEVRSGEILGIAGVSGNGQTELAEVLFGTLKPSSGQIILDGKDLQGADPDQFLNAGIGRIPEDRHQAILGELTVAENMVLERLDEFTQHGLLDYQQVRAYSERLIAEYQIKALPTDRMRTLSGGNIQKVILARVLSRQPRVIVASQPTRGLDVGATEYVRSKLLEQRERGVAVLLISEDLDEVLALSDRIAVMYEGQIVGTLRTEEATLEQLGMMMAGSWKPSEEDAG